MTSADIFRERREAVYSWWEEANATLPAEHPGLQITDDLCHMFVARLVETFGPTVGKCVPAARVKDWLQHPDKFSPFVDHVAVSRALDFDWQVLRNLTTDERTEVARQLAAMDDPFGWAPDELEQTTKRVGGAWGSQPRRQSPREVRFMCGRPAERERLRAMVLAMRARMVRAAA